eukprot:211045-Rhodomonas_salina.1
MAQPRRSVKSGSDRDSDSETEPAGVGRPGSSEPESLAVQCSPSDTVSHGPLRRGEASLRPQ